MKTKIGIVGSRTYTNKKKVKDLIFEIKEKYGEYVEIVSGGQRDGADGFAKKYALEFGLKYVEFPPSHYNWNMHCIRPVGEYNKPYYVSNYFKRNKRIPFDLLCDTPLSASERDLTTNARRVLYGLIAQDMNCVL